MITAEDFLRPAREKGLTFFAGVPCSFLTPFINGVIGDARIRYVGAASEGEAVAIAAGAWLAGRKTVVMCQNSGLGNAVNPLTSLNYPFRIPTLLVVTWRKPASTIFCGETTSGDDIRSSASFRPSMENEADRSASGTGKSRGRMPMPFLELAIISRTRRGIASATMNVCFEI